MNKKEVKDKRDILEEKMKTLLNEFVTNTSVCIETAEVWVERSGNAQTSIVLRGDRY